MSVVKARLNILQPDQIRQIHEMAVTILEKTGIRVDDQTARNRFKSRLGASAEKKNICIPRELIEWAIEASPARIELLNRQGQPAFTLENSHHKDAVFGIGVTNLHYEDPLTNTITTFGREHMVQATRLGNALTEFDTIATPGVIQEGNPEQAELTGFLEMLANTEKPLTLLISKPETFKHCLQLCDELHGETATNTSVIPYFNPITPLILNEETCMKMEISASRGMPFIFSNYGMSGATCPITPGGTLAVLMAELLAGLVYSQLIREGTPIILGSLPAAFDMKKMQSYYTPQSMLINLACAEMMAHYKIPHCGTSGGWMGWGADLMAGTMLWQNHLTSVLGAAGLVPFVGNNFDSLVFSPATVIYAAEIIRMAREYTRGFSLEDEEIGMDEILQMGPGANYLTAKLTMKKFRHPLVKSEIWPFITLDAWKKELCPRAGDHLRDYTRHFMETLPRTENNEEILNRGTAFIRRQYP